MSSDVKTAKKRNSHLLIWKTEIEGRVSPVDFNILKPKSNVNVNVIVAFSVCVDEGNDVNMDQMNVVEVHNEVEVFDVNIDRNIQIVETMKKKLDF